MLRGHIVLTTLVNCVSWYLEYLGGACLPGCCVWRLGNGHPLSVGEKQYPVDFIFDSLVIVQLLGFSVCDAGF